MQAFTKHWPLLIFSITWIVFTLFTYKMWPIANGEEFRYLRGKETLVHLTQGVFTEKLVQPRPNYFLFNAYPMLLVWLNPHFYYEWFHLMNLLFALVGFVVVYFLVYCGSKSVRLALLSTLLLLGIPTFFGQLGVNPIDMPFTVFYLLALLLIYLLEKSPNAYVRILLLGIVFGFVQGLRQIGLSVYFIYIFYFMYIQIVHKQLPIRKVGMLLWNELLETLLIFIVATLLMLVLWPNFAINTFKSFSWYIFVGKDFYLWNYGLLFLGKFLANDQRPWFYLPLLQLITSPFWFLALFACGLFHAKKLLKEPLYFLVFIAFVFNYLLYFLLQPVIYDGTRHFMFMLPLMLILGILGLQKFKLNSKLSLVTLSFLLLNFLFVLGFHYKDFPYAYVYFNKLAYVFGNPYKNFESDYASLLYRKSAEWVRDVYVPQNLAPVKVWACDNGMAVDYYSQKKFITVINREDADLIICDYRDFALNNYAGQIIYSVDLDKNPANFVFKVK